MFKRIERQYNQDLVIIPGWGFDWRVFESMDLQFNYLFYTGKSGSECRDALSLLFSKAAYKQYSVLGWSQGGFAVCDIADKYADCIDQLVLMSVRQAYDGSSLQEIMNLIRKNRRAYMLGFYRSCFNAHDQLMFRWFRKTLLSQYLTDKSADELIEDLLWLAQARITVQALSCFERVTIVHGLQDQVVPVSYAQALARSTDSRLLLLDKCGHLPFLKSDLKKHLC